MKRSIVASIIVAAMALPAMAQLTGIYVERFVPATGNPC